MNFRLIIGLIFLMGCSSSQDVSKQKMEKDLTIELISSTKKGEYFDFNFAVKNNTNRPVMILKHKGLNERSKNDVALSGAFYQMDFLPYEVACEYEPEFMDQELIENKVFKTATDFVTIGSKKKYTFSVKSKDYLLGVCDESSKQFKLIMKYEPKKRYMEKVSFDSQYKYAKDAQQYFDKLENSYQEVISSDTLVVKF